MTEINKITEQKDILRKDLRQNRETLRNRPGKSLKACQRVLKLSEWNNAHTVLLYVSYGSELETTLLMQMLMDTPNKQCVVPFCLPNGELDLFEIRSNDELSSGSYGILEPNEQVRSLPERRIAPESLDLVLLPGIGFDTQGRRLGQGGGFYDHLLPKLQPSTLTVGLAFDCQIVPEIPTEPHDSSVRCLVTESRTLWPVQTPVNQFPKKPFTGPHVLGILGGIASGKSFVSYFFRSHGVPVFDADRFGHTLYERPDFREILLNRWGAGILNIDGSINRKKVAQIVFTPMPSGAPSPELAFLDNLFHPAIHQAWLTFRAEATQKGYPLIILDAALLLESGWQKECDDLLFVTTPREKRIAFARARGWTARDLELREKNQLPLNIKKAAATLCVTNSGSTEELCRKLQPLLPDFRRSSYDPAAHDARFRQF